MTQFAILLAACGGYIVGIAHMWFKYSAMMHDEEKELRTKIAESQKGWREIGSK